MDDRHDDPPLLPYQLEELEVELYRVDEAFWTQLAGLQVSIIVNLAIFGPGPTPPGPPKRPIELKGTLCSYAEQLFYVEASKYPPARPNFVRWLLELAPKVESRVLRRLQELESKNYLKSIRYHGVSDDELRETIAESNRESIKRFAGDRPIPELPKPQRREDTEPNVVATERPQKDPTEALPVTANAEIDRRKMLLEDYKAATHTSNRKIYEARNSGIHKPQFYEWINGVLPAQSATAVNFERFLAAKKPPIPRNPK